MKVILVYIILIIFSSSLCAQDSNLLNQSIKFVGLTFVITESNPIEKHESELINNTFQTSLKEYQNKASSSLKAQEVSSIFNVLYQNGSAVYSDTEEERRMKLRRAGCFASVALLSDIESGYTFIQFAKFALSENIDKPNIEFLEEQYLGLLFIEMIFKYEDNQLNKNDLKVIHEFINCHNKKLTMQIKTDAINLLEDFNTKI